MYLSIRSVRFAGEFRARFFLSVTSSPANEPRKRGAAACAGEQAFGSYPSRAEVILAGLRQSGGLIDHGQRGEHILGRRIQASLTQAVHR